MSAVGHGACGVAYLDAGTARASLDVPDPISVHPLAVVYPPFPPSTAIPTRTSHATIWIKVGDRLKTQLVWLQQLGQDAVLYASTSIPIEIHDAGAREFLYEAYEAHMAQEAWAEIRSNPKQACQAWIRLHLPHLPDTLETWAPKTYAATASQLQTCAGTPLLNSTGFGYCGAIHQT